MKVRGRRRRTSRAGPLGHAAKRHRLGAGRYGNALSFDGINDQVALADPATIGTGTTDFSFMAWVKRSALGWPAAAHLQQVRPQRLAGRLQGVLLFAFERSDLRRFASGDTNSVTIADTAWHHVALVFTRATNTVQFYVDGTLRTTATKNLEADNAARLMHHRQPCSTTTRSAV